LHRSAATGRVVACVVSVLALTSLFGAPASAAAASVAGRPFRMSRDAARATTTVTSVVHVTVQSRQTWTDTGVALRSGESVVVSASGLVHFGGGKIARLGPSGIPWGSACMAIAKGQARNDPWPARGLACWSLIGKVGAGTPFAVGAGTSFRVSTAGELSLGVNDNYVPDNSGTFAVTVSVSSLLTPATHSSNTTPIGVIVGAAVAVLFLVFALWWALARRRRRRPEPTDRTAMAASVSSAVDPPFTDLSAPIPPVVTAGPPLVFAPPEADSIDVNIFEVEFSNGLTLRVGYNHFPEGTPLRWRVTQNRGLAAFGDFVTQGGGSTTHLETIPLGVKLQGRDMQPDGADVEFEWSINGVPFRYSVRRDPNC
jgi:hypothetical protein